MGPVMAASAASASASASNGAAGQSLLDSQCQASVALFKQSWGTYQKMLASDFMEHAALYAALRTLLHQLGIHSVHGVHGTYEPLAMLDLGCGDAMQIAAALRQCGAPAGDLRLASYTGVDMSAPALQLAAGYLAFLQPQCAVNLVEQDMKAYVTACPDQQFDLAFSSFAVHHLSLEGKVEFASQVARCLKPGGLFVVVDIFRREGEERGQYMDRYQTNMDEAVRQGIIEANEAEKIMQHITNYDFPERLSDYEALAQSAGFTAANCLFTDSKEFGRLVVLRK